MSFQLLKAIKKNGNWDLDNGVANLQYVHSWLQVTQHSQLRSMANLDSHA
jgi:hypothetical protein